MEDNIFGLLFVGFVFWLGIVIGRMQAIQRLVKNFMQDPDSIQRLFKDLERVAKQAEEAKPKDQPEELRVERAGNQIYLYHKETNEFLAQGPDLQSALDVVEQRFPHRVFQGRLSKDQADALGITITK